MKNEMTKLLRMVTIFKMTLSRWPKNAAELVGFVHQRGWTVDVSSYYTLTFKPFSETTLAVDMAWPAPGNWLSCLRVEIEEVTQLGQDHLHFSIKKTNLPSQKRKTQSYCFIESPRAARKKSA